MDAQPRFVRQRHPYPRIALPAVQGRFAQLSNRSLAHDPPRTVVFEHGLHAAFHRGEHEAVIRRGGLHRGQNCESVDRRRIGRSGSYGQSSFACGLCGWREHFRKDTAVDGRGRGGISCAGGAATGAGQVTGHLAQESRVWFRLLYCTQSNANLSCSMSKG